MRYPEFLKEKGTIGYVAPSFGCATEPYKSCFENALKKLEKLGYDADLGPNCYVEKGIGISNTPQACGQELNDSYLSQRNDAIISCGGGELMCEVVPYIDFDAIAKAPAKWYMGYSDNTNFTFLSATLADTAAIYGPCISNFGMEPWHPSLEDTMALLTGKLSRVHGYDMWERDGLKDEEQPFLPYNLTEDTRIKYFVPGESEDTDRASFEGRLIGGCMDCLINLTGTAFDRVADFNEKYKDDGIIWFLEACDLNVMSIRRAIWHMKNAGWFQYVRGFLIGRPVCHGEEAFGIDHIQAVTDLLAEYQVPVILDIDIGHLPPMMPVVCGGTAKVEAEKNNIEITYTWM